MKSFHDFYAVCPSLKLLDENFKYCGGVCTKTKGACTPDTWETNLVPDLKNKFVFNWRVNFQKALDHCDAFVTTSDSAKDIVCKAFPKIPKDAFHVIPHGRNFKDFGGLQSLPRPFKKIRILVPGNIDTAKGFDILKQICLLDDTGLIEFHVLGNVIDPNWTPVPQIKLHGSFKSCLLYTSPSPRDRG